MKLIIDIPEEEYKMRLLWAKSDNLCSPDTMMIAKGVPYGEISQGDLISREDLKKAITEATYNFEQIPIRVDKVQEIIDNAPTVDAYTFKQVKELFDLNVQMADEIENLKRPQDEWIPASERLPDDMQRVLIWFEYYRYGDFNCMYQTYGFGYVCDGKWSPFINGETGWQDYNIIAWQPLPEPYKKGGAK